MSDTTQSQNQVFTSWKEIAAFFGKGVRTVQRWEHSLGLPLSRPTGSRNVVVATESELREWIRRSGPQAQNRETAVAESADELTARLKRLEAENERLAATLNSLARELAAVKASTTTGSGDGIGESRRTATSRTTPLA